MIQCFLLAILPAVQLLATKIKELLERHDGHKGDFPDIILVSNIQLQEMMRPTREGGCMSTEGFGIRILDEVRGPCERDEDQEYVQP